MVDEPKDDANDEAQDPVEMVPIRVLLPAMTSHGVSAGRPGEVPEPVALRLFADGKAAPDLEAISPEDAGRARRALADGDFDEIRALHSEYHPGASNRTKAELSAELADMISPVETG